MNQNRYPLRFNVGFLINQPVGSTRDIHFDFPSLYFHPDLEVKDLKGVARVSRTPQGILLQADFEAVVKTECVRCLNEFEQPLHIRFQDIYAFSSRSVSESGLILPEDGNINLEPLLREYFLVEMPIRPLCREDCKGLCPVCGEDLNIETCEHSERVKLE